MDIEEFVNDYLKEHRHDVLLSPYNGLIDFANTFKKQMMKEAIEAIAHPLDKEIWCDLDKFPELEDGDNIQIIIIKKEDK